MNPNRNRSIHSSSLKNNNNSGTRKGRKLDENLTMTLSSESLPNNRADCPQIGAGQSSPVMQMFHGRSVFTTGASGFIGRVLLEKLLRSYQGIRRIYILMRTKKNKNPYDRLQNQLLKVPIFDRIRAMENGKHLLDKIVIIAGDIGEPRLGISDEDMATMEADETLSIVFHSAATVKFDEPMKQSVRLNLIATREIINLCRRLPNLIGLCHVSTAYANCDILDNSDIEEKLYPINYEPYELIKMCEILDYNMMQSLKVQLVDRRPNTYTYTKAMAEHLIAMEAADLPVTIIRPSIVTGAWKEPIPGWVDNINGPTGLLLSFGKGLLRTLHLKHSVRADMIPVDVVVNTMIASTFYTAKMHNKLDSGVEIGSRRELTEIYGKLESPQPIGRKLGAAETQANSVSSSDTFEANEETQFSHYSQEVDRTGDTTKMINLANGNKPDANSDPSGMTNGISGLHENDKCKSKMPHIVHCNSGDVNPISWGQIELMFYVIREYPSCQVLRYPVITFRSNRYADLITRIFAHLIPALIIDMICGLLGKKRQLLPVYNKLHSATAALRHFTTHNYNFKAGNLKLIESNLSEADKKDLFMDITSLDWRDYFEDYVLGMRRFVLKESDDSLPGARKTLQRVYYIEIGLRVALAAIALALLLPILTSPIRATLSDSCGKVTDMLV